MAIRVTCPKPGCGGVFMAEDRAAGTVVKCPKCGGQVRLKAAGAPAGPDSTPPIPPELLRVAAKPHVERLGPPSELRWAAGILVGLVIVAVVTFLGFMVFKNGRMVKVAETGPPPAAPLESPPVVLAPKPPEVPPAKPKEAAPLPIVSPQPAAPKAPAKPVFDSLEYARDIAPVNDLIDRFQYAAAIEKTQSLAAKYDSTPEGQFLIKQKLLNIASLKDLRAAAFSRVNNAIVKVSMKDLAPDYEGEVLSADEQQLVSSTGDAKKEWPWSSLKKFEVYMFYARSGAENEPAGHASLAAFLMEGTFHADLIARSQQELGIVQRRGLDVSDLQRYLDLLKQIQAALEKATPPSEAKAEPSPEAKAEPPKEEVKDVPKRPSPPKRLAGKPSHSEMVLVPAGEFIMGDDSIHDASPKRKIYLNAFYMDKDEVTNAEYAKFCRATGYRTPRHWQGGRIPPGRENHPVVCVSWEDASAYVNWAGKRLPTEAEWEKAARGTDGRRFPWGSTWSPSKCNSGFRLAERGFQATGNERVWEDNLQKWLRTLPGSILMGEGGGTMPVGSFPDGASPYGCMDMAGNVAELCQDGYISDYYKIAPDRNPPGPGTALYRVSRSGSWACYAKAVQCSYRGMGSPGEANCFIGFRCAKNAP